MFVLEWFYRICIYSHAPRTYLSKNMPAVFAVTQNIGCSGVQHLLHLKSKSKILRPIEIMGFFYEFFCQIQGNNLL